MRPLKYHIDEIITPAALDHRIRFYEHHKQDVESTFYKDIEKFLSGYIESEAKRYKEESYFLDLDLLRSKAHFEVLSEFREEESLLHGQCLYDNGGFKEIEDWDHWFLAQIKNEIEESEFKVLSAGATGNVWDWKAGKRVCEERKIFKLEHNDRTQMTFELPFTEDEFIHVLFFSVCPSLQGSYFHMRKRFKAMWELLAVQTGLKGLYSPVLGADMPEIPLKAYSGKPDWRFTKIQLEDNPNCTKLMKMYLMLGGQKPELENEHPDTLYFPSPRIVIECKKALMKNGKPNPHKHIYKSIYDSELEKELRR